MSLFVHKSRPDPQEVMLVRHNGFSCPTWARRLIIKYGFNRWAGVESVRECVVMGSELCCGSGPCMQIMVNKNAGQMRCQSELRFSKKLLNLRIMITFWIFTSFQGVSFYLTMFSLFIQELSWIHLNMMGFKFIVTFESPNTKQFS